MTEMTEKGLGRTLMIDDSKKYFTGNVFEYFWAFFMHDQLFALGTRDEEVITLFEQFQKEYPNSQYSKYIKPYVDNVVKYHQIIKNPFGEEIKFLENYENVNTLEDAIKTLKGKAIYVDVWASWCGPCKAEFAHNAELKKVLDEKDISILYISIDDDTRNAQWLNDIKYYNLAGTHIRVNKLFDSDLRRLFDKNGGLAIPWYILIDKDGNILDLDAGSPSQLVPGKKIISVNKL
jgi:thiol-disulfide isomerase/thioredoxin